MLRGREHFFGAWRELVTQAVRQPPLLDVGASQPFQKELAWVRGVSTNPVVTVDINWATTLDAIADAHSLPFAAGAFGGVICSHVLEHVEHPHQVVEELRRVLRPGGLAYVTLLDVWPYHAKAPDYRDFHRFKSDAVDLLFSRWDNFQVLRGGGVVQTALNFCPLRAQPVVQRVANVVDPRIESNITPVRYVLARR